MPVQIEFSSDPETTIQRAETHLIKSGYLKKGDQVVIISDILAREKLINAVQMRII
jgi:adenine/guanine phosphoribosyltransferase-like PRPP-binding protein